MQRVMNDDDGLAFELTASWFIVSRWMSSKVRTESDVENELMDPLEVIYARGITGTEVGGFTGVRVIGAEGDPWAVQTL